MPAIRVPAGSCNVALNMAGDAAAKSPTGKDVPADGPAGNGPIGAPALRITSTISIVVPATIITPITMTAIFNARSPDPMLPPHCGYAYPRTVMRRNEPITGPIRIAAGPEASGQRIDRFLADAIGTISRSRVKTLIEEARLTAGARLITEPAEPVRGGAVYTLDVPAPAEASPQPQSIPFTILYEDADLIVLDKPAGLVVHPAPGNPDGTLVNALLAHCAGEGGGLAGSGLTGIGSERRPGIVHRLDKDTSGVMVVAKTQLASDKLTAAFAARDLDRTYLALVWGLPAPIAGEIEGAIGRDRRDRKRMAVVPSGGKVALTRYRTLRAWQTSLALLECRLATGRTHQIRVHLSARGHPLVGDPLYLRHIPAAARRIQQPLRGELLDFPRQALHAASLGFAHPRSGEPIAFHASLPDDMAGLIDAIDRTAV
jgi:23S rRNA pseudouridine1911/1915/1917 synthase